MRTPFTLCLALVLAGPAAANTVLLSGQVNDISFGDSHAQVVAKLRTSCKSSQTHSAEPVSFPLARQNEKHLICHEYELGEHVIDVVAFTFADDQLVMLNASGGAVKPIVELVQDTLDDYLHYKVSFSEGMLADPRLDIAWVLSKKALHPNLFMWTNPYLKETKQTVTYPTSAQTPDVLRFGGRIDELTPLYKKHCEFMGVRTTTPWLLSKPKVQQQIDCFGYVYAGFPRKIEAVFGDGVLEQAWILTGKGEEDRVRARLMAEFGLPIYVDNTWEVFDKNRVMLRKDKPEVLILSDKLAPLFREQNIGN